MKSISVLVVLVLCPLIRAACEAGMLTSPPPSFDGNPGRVVYRMGPVQYDPGWVDTLVTCKNLADAPVKVEIEIFDDQDSVSGLPTRASVQPEGEVTFATSAGSGWAGAMPVIALAPCDGGKARVSSTTSKLSCTGMHRIRGSDGAIKEAPLQLIKKVSVTD